MFDEDGGRERGEAALVALVRQEVQVLQEMTLEVAGVVLEHLDPAVRADQLLYVALGRARRGQDHIPVVRELEVAHPVVQFSAEYTSEARRAVRAHFVVDRVYRAGNHVEG